VRAAEFAAPIYLVNPKHREIDGLRCVARIEDLPQAPDLIVITTPPATIPAIVASAGQKGVAATALSPRVSVMARGRSPKWCGSKRVSTACASSGSHQGCVCLLSTGDDV
jgi:predicted CoA-binding protein